MLVSKYFVFFIFYSFLGWIYESCYCTLHEHSWQNRGFLYGPCVPMYGVATVIVQIIFYDLPKDKISNWVVFFTCALGSFVLEYATSYFLEKMFHARWWDYSHLPLNINGRVCLLFTVCFGLAGIVIVNFFIPYIAALGHILYPAVFELLALLFMFIFGMDMALTVSALTTFSKKFEEINEQINAQIAEKYAQLEINVSEAKAIGLEKYEAVLEKKDMTAEKLLEIKEQITNEYLAKALLRSSKTERAQLRHIAKFTHPQLSTKLLIEKGSNLLKSKRKEPK